MAGPIQEGLKDPTALGLGSQELCEVAYFSLWESFSKIAPCKDHYPGRVQMGLEGGLDQGILHLADPLHCLPTYIHVPVRNTGESPTKIQSVLWAGQYLQSNSAAFSNLRREKSVFG